MRKNLFTFNFKDPKKIILLNAGKNLVIMFVVFSFMQNICFWAYYLSVSNPSTQIVKEKRVWVKGKIVPEFLGGKDIVLIFGDSRAISGILPSEFDREIKENTLTYNLALPASSAGSFYYLLKDFLKNNPSPKYIILLTFPRAPRTFFVNSYLVRGASIGQVLTYIVKFRDKNIILDYVSPLEFRRKFGQMIGLIIGKVDNIIPKKLKKHMLNKYRREYISKENIYEERVKYMIENRGFFAERARKKIVKTVPDDFDIKDNAAIWFDEENYINDPFIDDFIQLAKKENITVAVVRPPVFYMNEQLSYGEDIENYWKEKARHYNNVVLLSEEKYIYRDKFFQDAFHLNIDGVVQYTKELAKDFKKVIRKR